MAGNAAKKGSSLKQRSPGEVRFARASDVNTLEKDHEMNTTSNAADINVQGKTAQVFQFNQSHDVRVQVISGEPWFCLADVCETLTVDRTSRLLRDLDEKGLADCHTLTKGGEQLLKFVNEPNIYRVIFRSNKSEAKQFQDWVFSDVLPSIRKQGQYTDHRSIMNGLLGSVIGTSGVNVLDRVIDQKASPVPAGLQRSFKQTIKSRLRSRFNVQRTDLIPADALADACNFVAAYALEGEWLGKEEKPEALFTLDFPRAQDLSLLLHYTDWVMHRWNNSIRAGLKELNPELYNSTWEFFMEAQRASQRLDKSMPDLVAYFQKTSSGKRPQQIAGSAAA